MKKILNNKTIIFAILSFGILFVYLSVWREYGFNILMTFFMLLALITAFLYSFKEELFDKIVDFVVKRRFIIALVVFILLVLLKVSGSSIGMYDLYFSNEGNNISYKLFGEARAVRGDEWLAMTSYNMSQTFNGFNVFSKIVSLTGQNMIVGYNSPVLDVTMLGKPLSWGYILLGRDYGLSWYWNSKIILFIILSFELCMILTKGNKKLSLLGALLISFSPVTMWWFAPHMPDVVIWFMAITTLSYHLLFNESKLKKNIITAILPFVFMEFVVALFPSYQVGFGYLYLVLMIALLLRENKNIFKDKGNIIRILIVGLVSLLLIGYFVITCKDALVLEMHTTYPGARVETGGSAKIYDLLTNLGTPFLAYTDKVLYLNPCEDSSYIHFGLFALMLIPSIVKYQKSKKDRNYFVGIALCGIALFYALFYMEGFSTLVSKITFFSYINRMKNILGFILVLLTIYIFNYIDLMGNKVNKKIYYIVLAIFAIIYFLSINNQLLQFMPIYLYVVEIVLIVGILVLLLTKYKKISYGLLLCLLTFSSICINPIIRGISPITNHPFMNVINDKRENDPDAYWISYNSIVYQGLLISNGVKTANALNFYPDVNKWDIIDPEHKYEDNWNRYAHIAIRFVDKENYVTNELTPDSAFAYLTIETLVKLNVKYVFANIADDLSKFNSKEYEFKVIYQDKDIRIYEIVIK